MGYATAMWLGGAGTGRAAGAPAALAGTWRPIARAGAAPTPPAPAARSAGTCDLVGGVRRAGEQRCTPVERHPGDG